MEMEMEKDLDTTYVLSEDKEFRAHFRAHAPTRFSVPSAWQGKATR